MPLPEKFASNLVRFGAVWCGLVRFGAVWCGLVRFGAVWCGLVRIQHYFPQKTKNGTKK
jgi:hypothetical protein